MCEFDVALRAGERACLAAGRTEGAVRGHGNCVDVVSVAAQVALELAVGQVPDLDQPVPAGRDDDGLVGDGREAHAGDPLRVALALCDGELALSQRVPQLDGLVSGARHNLYRGSSELVS